MYTRGRERFEGTERGLKLTHKASQRVWTLVVHGRRWLEKQSLLHAASLVDAAAAASATTTAVVAAAAAASGDGARWS